MAKKKPDQKSAFRSFLIFLAVFIAFASFLSLYNSPLSQPEEITINQLAEEIKAENVEKITVVESSTLKVELKSAEGEEPTELTSSKEVSESLPTLLGNYGVTAEQLAATDIAVEGRSGWKVLLYDFLPIFLPIAFIIFFIWIMMRQVQGGNNRAMMFGQTQAKPVEQTDKKKLTTFKDVAGAEEAKEELSEIVDFLVNPKKYTAIGAKIPKGVLMMGPPGTGKTLLARAVAGEAKVPFFHISGSEFVEMFVGVGASRVRDLFKKAKKASPAILFIDEIDAVGRQRGTGMGGSHDEREQTLNQILTEMDGFDNETNVIVIAATNRADVLDPALLRPGRFDRRVMLGLPDLEDRVAILEVHAKNKLFEDGISLRTIAQRAIGFSGADLMNLLNEAAIFAARNNRKKITMDDCLESFDKVLLGPQRKSMRMNEKEKEITAYHEAGHALVAHVLEDSDPVHKITILPRGRAGGYTLKLPDEDTHYKARKAMLADIAVSFGGHIAEMMQFGDVTTGPSSDLEKATKVARQIVMHYGMSTEMGPRTFGETSEMVFLGKEIHEQRDYSDATAERIDAEIDRIIRQQYAIAEKLMHDKKADLDKIANKLLEIETLEREQFEALMEGREVLSRTESVEQAKEEKVAEAKEEKSEEQKTEEPEASQQQS